MKKGGQWPSLNFQDLYLCRVRHPERSRFSGGARDLARIFNNASPDAPLLAGFARSGIVSTATPDYT
jgi:hypothetical protein